ncbi:unnamed protein product [Adineta steineri]|uniref:Uncharacterized protein n=1 Tax=Adineta steineri TaxID=433720 RepID=A0A815DEP5_9BILA|nr:unnamed protein product [Adineta steineri]CAF1571859.1 unnamed protein product [Adineta steineri]
MSISASIEKQHQVDCASTNNVKAVRRRTINNDSINTDNINDFITANPQINNESNYQDKHVKPEHLTTFELNDLPTTDNIDFKLTPVLIDVEQSSFEETLGVVPNTDDPNVLCLTFRSWTLGIICAAIGAVINTYLFLEGKTFAFFGDHFVLLIYPVGRFFAWILPTHTWFKNRRFAFSLNPGPFTIKEHTVIYSMIYMGVQSVPAVDLFIYRASLPENEAPSAPHYIIGLLLVISTQMIAFGLAGFLRRLLVWPSEMIWPWNFPFMVVIRTLNETESPLSTRWLGLTRRRFLVFVLTISFVYRWFPSFIFPMLTTFPWWCLIKPSSTRLSQVTGPNGLAMGLFPLDWLTIASGQSFHLIPPWWVYVNMIIGFVLIAWFIIPILYYCNVANWASLPVTGLNTYPVIDHSDQVQRTITVAIVDYIFWGSFLALFLHTILFHSRDLWKYARTSLHNRQNDVHCTLIGKYKEAPGWIFGILFTVTLLTACLICHFTHFLPWYYVIAATCIGTVFIVPMGLLQALSGILIDPSYIVYFISGFIFHNQPMQLATFYILLYGMQFQALGILTNFKLAHHMKVSPQSMFITQITATIIGATMNFVIMQYEISNVCNVNTNVTCGTQWLGHATTFATSDLNKLYGLESVYPSLIWVMVAVAVLPLFIWIAHKFWPQIKWLRFIHIPIMFGYLPNLQSGASGYLSLPTWFLLGFIFYKVIRRWWNATFPAWWGNQKNACPLASASANGSFPTTSA